MNPRPDKRRSIYQLSIQVIAARRLPNAGNLIPALVTDIGNALRRRIEVLEGPLPADFDPELYYVTKDSGELVKAYFWALRVCRFCALADYAQEQIDALLAALIRCAEPEIRESARVNAQKAGRQSGKKRRGERADLWIELAEKYRKEGVPRKHWVRKIQQHMRANHPKDMRSDTRVRQVLRANGL